MHKPGIGSGLRTVWSWEVYQLKKKKKSRKKLEAEDSSSTIPRIQKLKGESDQLQTLSRQNKYKDYLQSSVNVQH